MSKGRLFCGGSALAVTLAMTLGLAPSYAFAQPPADQPEDATVVDEIISTGTFIRGAAEDAAIPVEVIGRAELNERGSPNIEEIARSLTEVGNVQSQAAGGFNAQGYGVSSINLRNLGSGRTLVTFNGRRLADEPVSSGAANQVTGGAMQNINSIPMAALQQVEILKGSGGATYGSDAAAGVVNFITRRDLNGVEANASYSYIDGTDGRYAANVLWGRRNDLGNVLLSFEYEHLPELRARERDWARRPFYQMQSIGATPSFAAYQFFTRELNGTEALIRAGATPVDHDGNPLTAPVAANALYQGGADPNNFPQIGQLTSPYSQVNSGVLRDQACARVGGDLTFGGTINPLCQARSWEIGNLAEDTDRYNVFADVNFDISDTLRYHGEAKFSKNVTNVRNIIAGTLLSYGVQEPCDPLPATAVAASRACTPFNSVTGAQAYAVPGFNPAVYEYVSAYYNTPETTGQASTRVFTPAQIAGILGRPLGAGNTTGLAGTLTYANGGIIGQGYTAVAPGGTQIGRVALPANTVGWQPFFAEANNRAFHDGVPKIQAQNIEFRTTQELKGDLGEIWGNTVDFSAAVTYSRNITIREGKTILTDRLQRALNGFATNLDDPDGDLCTAAETTGSRTLTFDNPNTPANETVLAASTPYTVGAGGGYGDVNDPTFDAGAAAGNGCYFLNPFLSAVGVSRITGQAQAMGTATQVGFMGGPAAGGTARNYQGYAEGWGLANAPGIMRWIYGNRQIRSESDNVYLDLVFNGTFNKWELPGGPIGWAAGGQYRYVHRLASMNAEADDRINPCSFLSRESGLYQSVDNIVNPTSTCSGTDSPFTGFPGTNGVSGQGAREAINRALFAEFSLPVLENVGAQFAIRREEARQPFSTDTVSATVMNGSVKWQVTPNFALRGSIAETFDTPSTESPSITQTDLSSAGEFYSAAIPETSVNPATIRNSRTNLLLSPETGLNYDIGFIFQTSDRQIQANVAYFNNVVEGRPVTITSDTIGRALLGLPRVGQPLTPALFDCSSPTVQRLFEPGSTGGVFASDQAVVGYIDPVTGNHDYTLGCQTGTNLAGLDRNGDGDRTDATGPTPDLGLVFNIPDRVNAANTKVAGIETDVTWRVPQTVYGGNLVVSGDLTWNLYRREDDVKVFGALVTAATDQTGTLASGYAAQVNIWRGGLGATYLRDRHTVSLRATYVGSVADLAVADQSTQLTVPAATTNNLNPRNPSLCNFQGNMLPIPTGSLPQLEPFHSRENGLYNNNCTLTNGYGHKMSPQIDLTATWRYELPKDTTLTVSVSNLLDADPPFFLTQYGYQVFGSADAYGRQIKFAIEKKWPRAD